MLDHLESFFSKSEGNTEGAASSVKLAKSARYVREVFAREARNAVANKIGNVYFLGVARHEHALCPSVRDFGLFERAIVLEKPTLSAKRDLLCSILKKILKHQPRIHPEEEEKSQIFVEEGSAVHPVTPLFAAEPNDWAVEKAADTLLPQCEYFRVCDFARIFQKAPKSDPAARLSDDPLEHARTHCTALIETTRKAAEEEEDGDAA